MTLKFWIRCQSKADRRVEFIWESTVELRVALEVALGGSLHVLYDTASIAFPRLAAALMWMLCSPTTITSHRRSFVIMQFPVALRAKGVSFETRKDHVIFEKDEVLTAAGKFFSVFTPYKNAWLKRLEAFYVKPYPVETHKSHFAADKTAEIPALEAMGFSRAPTCAK